MDLLDVAAQSFSHSIGLLEAVYEETEDPNIERKFAIANVNLARVKLALEDHQGALEGFESAIGLLDGFSEEEGESLTVNVPPLLRARAMMGAGQAHFKLGNLQEAIERFEGALELSAEDAALRGQITVLLSQTLWAIGSEDFKESAKAQLLDW
jgi:superkiller protein 3